MATPKPQGMILIMGKARDSQFSLCYLFDDDVLAVNVTLYQMLYADHPLVGCRLKGVCDTDLSISLSCHFGFEEELIDEAEEHEEIEAEVRERRGEQRTFLERAGVGVVLGPLHARRLPHTVPRLFLCRERLLWTIHLSLKYDLFVQATFDRSRCGRVFAPEAFECRSHYAALLA